MLAGLIGIPMVDLTDSKKMKEINGESLIKTVREGRGEYIPAWAGSLSSIGGLPLPVHRRQSSTDSPFFPSTMSDSMDIISR